jgi:NADH:ubiquinone reductase (non-electrogenic)
VVPDLDITIIEGRSILGGFEASLREYTEKKFARDRVRIRTGANVTKVEATRLHLSDGDALDFGMCVWNTGIAPRRGVQLLDDAVFRKDKWHHLLTNNQLKVLAASPRAGSDGSHTTAAGSAAPAGDDTVPGVFALGDCASVGGMNYAATAQVAEQQGAWLAAAINDAAAAAGLPVSSRAARLETKGDRAATGTTSSAAGGRSNSSNVEATLAAIQAYSPPSGGFRYTHRGSLAFVGSFVAVNDYSAGAWLQPLRGTKLKGYMAWFLWRSAYLTKLGAWRNRLQVPIDWARTFVFGRDVTQF